MNPYIIIGTMLALAGAGAGGFRLGVDHVEAGQAREDAQIVRAVDAANIAAAKAIAGIKITNQKITQEVRHETSTQTVYRDCAHTPDGLRLVNQALYSLASGDSKLPPASAAK